MSSNSLESSSGSADIENEPISKYKVGGYYPVSLTFEESIEMTNDVFESFVDF